MNKLTSAAIFTLLLSIASAFPKESVGQFSSLRGFELGLRLGDTYGGQASLDFVGPVWGSRIHGNLTVNNNQLIVAGLKNWLFPIAENFTFYPGLGGIVALGDSFSMGIAGEIGVEYRFDIPLTIGLDWRPIIGIVNSSGFATDGFGLNVRYRF